jgi:hypothetical protein
VTIPGRGDLSPPRRHGRRRRPWRTLLILLVVAALVAGGWYVWTNYVDDDDSDTLRAGATPCVTPSHGPAPANLSSVKLIVLNGTNRVGLAHEVARQLEKRGAHIRRVGNTGVRPPKTTISYPPRAATAMLAVREQLAVTPRLESATPEKLVLVIGKDFTGLATRAAAGRARQRDVAAATPSPPACASS